MKLFIRYEGKKKSFYKRGKYIGNFLTLILEICTYLGNFGTLRAYTRKRMNGCPTVQPQTFLPFGKDA